MGDMRRSRERICHRDGIERLESTETAHMMGREIHSSSNVAASFFFFSASVKNRRSSLPQYFGEDISTAASLVSLGHRQRSDDICGSFALGEPPLKS